MGRRAILCDNPSETLTPILSVFEVMVSASFQIELQSNDLYTFFVKIFDATFLGWLKNGLDSQVP